MFIMYSAMHCTPWYDKKLSFFCKFTGNEWDDYDCCCFCLWLADYLTFIASKSSQDTRQDLVKKWSGRQFSLPLLYITIKDHVTQLNYAHSWLLALALLYLCKWLHGLMNIVVHAPCTTRSTTCCVYNRRYTGIKIF